MKYIALGEKKKGRFVKSEMMSIDEFEELMSERVTKALLTKVVYTALYDSVKAKRKPLFCRFTKLFSFVTSGVKFGSDLTLQLIISKMNSIIDEDKKGKKVIKKIKKELNKYGTRKKTK